MEHNEKSRRWRAPRVLGAAALAAGLLAVGLPAGVAHASPAASTPTQYSLNFVGSATAAGHTWIVDLNARNDSVAASLSTTYKGVSEQHTWLTTAGFAATAAKELKVASNGTASFATGKALSPVLSVTAKFTPVKAAKSACSDGSDTVYRGKVTGSLTLSTGLKSVKVALTFKGKAGASLDVDKSCTPKTPVKAACSGSSWFLAAPGASDNVAGSQTLGSKPVWDDVFAVSSLKTASKWVTRSALVEAAGPAAKLSTSAQTVTVSGLSSGAVTGAAVISYNANFAARPVTCYQGSKKYNETATEYFGTVKVSKPFKANTALAGTMTAKTPNQGIYYAVKLTAA